MNTQGATLSAIDHFYSIVGSSSLPAVRRVSPAASRGRPAHHSAPVGDVAGGVKRKVGREGPPAKRPRASPSASQRHDMTPGGSEERGSKRKASREVEQGRRSRTSPSPSGETSSKPSAAAAAAAAASTSSGHGQPDLSAVFQARYVEEELLGKGGNGAVYAGYRRQDNLHVAIKHTPQKAVKRTPVFVNGQQCNVPRELLLLCMALAGCPTVGSSAAVALIDCFELDHELILVMERPVPCIDLFDYIVADGPYMEEDDAKVIMKQLVDAFIELHSKGVLHRDIKPENILVQTGPDGPRIRVIDFDCGTKLAPGTYTELSGTPLFYPPEYFLRDSYEGDPLTVWQLGALLYMMLHDATPFTNCNDIIFKTPSIRDELSLDCQQILLSCLAKNATRRPRLQDLPNHCWLQ